MDVQWKNWTVIGFSAHFRFTWSIQMEEEKISSPRRKFTSPRTAKIKLQASLANLSAEGAVKKQTQFYDDLAQRVRQRKALFDELVFSAKRRGSLVTKSRPPKKVSNKIAALIGKFEYEKEDSGFSKSTSAATFQGRKAQGAVAACTEEKADISLQSIAVKRGVVKKHGGQKIELDKANKVTLDASMQAEELEAVSMGMQHGLVMQKTRKGQKAGFLPTDQAETVLSSVTTGKAYRVGTAPEQIEFETETSLKPVTVSEEAEELVFTEFTREMAQSLLGEEALFSARMLCEYDATYAREISVPADAQLEVFEVSEDGEWAFVKHEEQLGWVPVELMKKKTDHSLLNQYGEEMGNSALAPSMPIRTKILQFISSSELFSEIRLTNELQVFVDDIDLVLREGRTLTGTLACLLHLDDKHRKFDSFESLAFAVKSLRKQWDPSVKSFQDRLCSHLLPKTSKIEPWSGDKILMMSSAADKGLEYTEGINEPFSSQSDLIVFLAQEHSKRRESLKLEEIRIKETLLSILQRPDIRLFEDAYLDVDQRSLEQLIANGFTEHQIVQTVNELNDEGRTFKYFGDLMGTVWEMVKGVEAPVEVVRAYARGDSDGIAEIDEKWSPQQKVDYLMKTVTNAKSKLFSSQKSNVRIKAEDLQELLQRNVSFTGLICDVKLLNALGRRFSSFIDLMDAQRSSELTAMKKSVQEYLIQWDKLNGDVSKYITERFIAVVDWFSHPLELLQSDPIQKGGPYADISALISAAHKAVKQLDMEYEKGKGLVLEYLSMYPMFKESVQVFASDIENLMRIAKSGETACECMTKLRAQQKAFSSFDELSVAVGEIYDTI